jgi:hypothetical protein
VVRGERGLRELTSAESTNVQFRRVCTKRAPVFRLHVTSRVADPRSAILAPKTAFATSGGLSGKRYALAAHAISMTAMGAKVAVPFSCMACPLRRKLFVSSKSWYSLWNH